MDMGDVLAGGAAGGFDLGQGGVPSTPLACIVVTPNESVVSNPLEARCLFHSNVPFGTLYCRYDLNAGTPVSRIVPADRQLSALIFHSFTTPMPHGSCRDAWTLSTGSSLSKYPEALFFLIYAFGFSFW